MHRTGVARAVALRGPLWVRGDAEAAAAQAQTNTHAAPQTMHIHQGEARARWHCEGLGR